jgi:hypothetical protein
MKRYTTKEVKTVEGKSCSCYPVAGEPCHCGAFDRYTVYGIYDNKLKRFTRHTKTEGFYRKVLIKKVRELNEATRS